MDWHAPPRLDDPNAVERIRAGFRVAPMPLLLQGALTLALGLGVAWTLLQTIPLSSRRAPVFALVLILALGLPALSSFFLLQRSRLLAGYQMTLEQWRDWRVERVIFTGRGTRLSIGRTQQAQRLRWRAEDHLRHGMTGPAPVKLAAKLHEGDPIYVAFHPDASAAPLYLGRAA